VSSFSLQWGLPNKRGTVVSRIILFQAGSIGVSTVSVAEQVGSQVSKNGPGKCFISVCLFRYFTILVYLKSGLIRGGLLCIQNIFFWLVD
jgi:hypothetical protein